MSENAWDVMRASIQQAQSTLRAVDAYANSMADVIVGRLRKVDDADTLRALKRELRDFDMVTGRWKR